MPGPKRFSPKEWFQQITTRFKRSGAQGGSASRRSFGDFGKKLGNKIPKKFKDFDFDLKKVQIKNVSEHAGLIRAVLFVLAVFLVAEIVAHIVGLFVHTPPPHYPTKPMAVSTTQSTENYDDILNRNMFNVEGTIPELFDQGQLDCFSTARPTTQKLELLGTIVMGDEKLSVALVQEPSNPVKLAVKKDELFFNGKYQAMKIERRKLCFQVKSTGDFETLEIPDEAAALGLSSLTMGGGGRGGVVPVSETEFAVKKNFLEGQLGNINEILQTARAVPYIETGTNKFKGFLVQSIEPNSPFAQLGVRPGDILTAVNDILLDNPGKGLEAFQKLRSASAVELKIIRGGVPTTLNYKVQN